MRIIVFAIALTFFVSNTIAQNDVVKEAEFVGGNEQLKDYLKQNLIYPEQAKKDHLEGYYILLLAIDDRGKPIFSDFLEKMKSCEECEKEALRLVNRMPRWNPKTINDKPTFGSAVVAIIFELEEGNIKFVEAARTQQHKISN
ncbi:MAG TPA: energy transducer TonB [Chitinophagales bacterium]|nr:energy transducer TonB [Chitinophagales bacterium]